MTCRTIRNEITVPNNLNEVFLKNKQQLSKWILFITIFDVVVVIIIIIVDHFYTYKHIYIYILLIIIILI